MKTETLTEQEIKEILETAIENYSELTNLADGYDNDEKKFKQFVEQYHADQFKVELSEGEINKLPTDQDARDYAKKLYVTGSITTEHLAWLSSFETGAKWMRDQVKQGLSYNREDIAVGFA